MIPRTLDSIEMVSLNSLISSYGRHKASEAYRKNCERISVTADAWALRYLELYVRYSSEKTDFFIDGVASKKALTQVQKEFSK